MLNDLQQRLINKALDITPEQGILLMQLGIEEGVSQQEIANRIFKDKSSVKRLIDSMERKSLLVRVEDKNDRRNKLIYLTYKGRTVKQEVIEVKTVCMEEIKAKIDEDEMKVCKKVLSQIFEIFDKNI
jgi:DNA-binding MarR family transcriptional regulator